MRVGSKAALLGTIALSAVCATAEADSITRTIDTEWIISGLIFDAAPLPAVQSIDSIEVDIAHTNGTDLAIYLDSSAVEGDVDFELMFQEVTLGGEIFSMGVAAGDGTLANVGAYEFVASGGGDWSAPHSSPGALNANLWTTGPIEAGDLALFIFDLNIVLDGGAIGTWTVNYTPAVACEPCDTNCDGSTNLFDIASFVDRLGGAVDGCSACAADANGDGSVNLFDIAGFVDCL